MFRFSVWLTSGDVSWAEEITAETYRRTWEKCECLDAREDVATTWLLTTARNIYIDEYRRARRTSTLAGGLATSPNERERSVEREHVQDKERQEFWGLIAQLPMQHREMLVLRYVFDWKVKDIAGRLGKKPNTVSAAIRRSLSILEARLEAGTGSKEE